MKVEKIELPSKLVKTLWREFAGHNEIPDSDIVCDVHRGAMLLHIVCVDSTGVITRLEARLGEVDERVLREALTEMLPFCLSCGVIHLDNTAWFLANGEIIGRTVFANDVREIVKRIMELVVQ